MFPPISKNSITVLKWPLEGVTKSHQNGLLDQVSGYRIRTFQFPFVLELDFSGDRRNGCIDVADTRYDRGIAGQNRPALRIADNVLQTRYRQALAYSGALINPLVCSCFEGDAFNDLFDETGNDGLAPRFVHASCSVISTPRSTVAG